MKILDWPKVLLTINVIPFSNAIAKLTYLLSITLTIPWATIQCSGSQPTIILPIPSQSLLNVCLSLPKRVDCLVQSSPSISGNISLSQPVILIDPDSQIICIQSQWKNNLCEILIFQLKTASPNCINLYIIIKPSYFASGLHPFSTVAPFFNIISNNRTPQSIQQIEIKLIIFIHFIQFSIIEESMSQYSKYLNSIELENIMRRSRVEAEIVASRLVAEDQLRRSRIETTAAINKTEKEEALRRSRIQAKVAEEQATLRRSRLQEQAKVEISLKEEAVRREKATGEVRMAEASQRAERRRQQLQAQIAVQKKMIEEENMKCLTNAELAADQTKKRYDDLQAQTQLELQNQKVAFEEVVRRRQVEADVANDELIKLEAWRKERREADILAEKVNQEECLRRSRILQELEAERLAREEEIIKSRNRADMEMEKWLQKSNLWRQTQAKQNMTDSILRRQRLDRQLDDAYMRRVMRW